MTPPCDLPQHPTLRHPIAPPGARPCPPTPCPPQHIHTSKEHVHSHARGGIVLASPPWRAFETAADKCVFPMYLLTANYSCLAQAQPASSQKQSNTQRKTCTTRPPDQIKARCCITSSRSNNRVRGLQTSARRHCSTSATCIVRFDQGCCAVCTVVARLYLVKYRSF